MIQTNVEELKKWIREDDIFIVHRGFRDAEAVLDDIGIQVKMPAFLIVTQSNTRQKNPMYVLKYLHTVNQGDFAPFFVSRRHHS